MLSWCTWRVLVITLELQHKLSLPHPNMSIIAWKFLHHWHRLEYMQCLKLAVEIDTGNIALESTDSIFRIKDLPNRIGYRVTKSLRVFRIPQKFHEETIPWPEPRRKAPKYCAGAVVGCLPSTELVLASIHLDANWRFDSSLGGCVSYIHMYDIMYTNMIEHVWFTYLNT